MKKFSRARPESEFLSLKRIFPYLNRERFVTDNPYENQIPFPFPFCFFYLLPLCMVSRPAGSSAKVGPLGPELLELGFKNRGNIAPLSLYRFQ